MTNYLLTLLCVLSFLIPFTSIGQNSTGDEEEVLMESYPNDHDFYNFYIYDSVEYSQSTPYHALHTHLDFLKEDNYHPKVAARVFPTKVGNLDYRIELANELKLVFAAKGIYVNTLDLPLEKNYIEKNTQKKRYIIDSKIPDIYLIKVGDRWRYSSYSALKVRSIFEEVYPSYSREFIKFISSVHKGQKYVLGLKVWQWGAILVLLLALYLTYYISQWLFSVIIRVLFSKQENPNIIHLLIKKYSSPVVIALLCLLFHLALPLLLLDSYIMLGLSIAVKFVFGLCIATFLFRTADILVAQLMFSRKRFSIDRHLAPVLRSSFRLVALMLGILSILKVMGYNINNLVTGISFGGLIIAFAAQDTVKNFIGSIMLFTDKPFKVGDSIIVKGQSGIVEEIGFRTTKIRTFDNSLVSLPNNLAADNDINNMGKRHFRRFRTMLSLEYGSDRHKVKEFIQQIRTAIDEHEITKKEGYQVRLYQFAPSSIDVLLNVFFVTDDYDIELKSREELMFTIMEIADKVGVNFAFPTQTIHLSSEDKEV
ncbi:mechanosensitive ion channel family protein [Flammeovirga sp. SubArs3]|uniref:mechanosensitive ion channel family protein n=1 Tax=Flammeovirga sp. SubArs3 TaxID=2995316 RepID=UPI00248D039B|nr:mechanosensitive ion channel family protein [Flammeovirga sp. SubArs3]